jgi:hypothetical protein
MEQENTMMQHSGVVQDFAGKGSEVEVQHPERKSSKDDQKVTTSRVETKNEKTNLEVKKSEWPKPSEIYNKEGTLTRSVTTKTQVTKDKPAGSGSKSAGDKAPQTASKGPPPNAPTGPKALRKSQAKKVTSQAVIPLSKSTPAESGSWSQSKRWVSQETKERMAFHKMKLNLHHIRADASPFIPQSPSALAALRLQGEKRRATQELETKRHGKGENGVRLFGGKRFRDMLSPVLAWNHCFTEG